MRMGDAINSYLADMRSEGWIKSNATEVLYYGVLKLHAADVNNRDPRTTNRSDVKRTLARWDHPNTKRIRRSILISFYRWTVEEGLREFNPAEQTRRPKPIKASKYRLTAREAGALLASGRDQREQWALHLGLISGLRSQELRGLRGRHVVRHDVVHVSEDIGKGGRERWVPALAQLRPVLAEVKSTIGPDEFVLCAIRWRNPGVNTEFRCLRDRPLSAKGLWGMVKDAGVRAGIAAPIGPHTMRHAFADHIARHAGERAAQELLGHASIATTELYLSASTLDELQASVAGVPGYPLPGPPISPVPAVSSLEPVLRVVRDDELTSRIQAGGE